MGWLKNALIDMAVTVLIVLATTLDVTWARWVILIYTPLILFLKIVALAGGSLIGQFKSKQETVPSWVYHLLYAVNVLASAIDQWWLITGGWALIWVLSFAIEYRLRPGAVG